MRVKKLVWIVLLIVAVLFIMLSPYLAMSKDTPYTAEQALRKFGLPVAECNVSSETLNSARIELMKRHEEMMKVQTQANISLVQIEAQMAFIDKLTTTAAVNLSNPLSDLPSIDKDRGGREAAPAGGGH